MNTKRTWFSVFAGLVLLLTSTLPTALSARADAPLRTPHFLLRTLNFALPQWQQLFPATSPPPRSDVAMTYDTRREMAVMFGGYGYPATGGSTTWLDETWEWDSQGQTWVQRFPAHKPPKRMMGAMAYDEAQGVSVLFGGFSNIVDGLDDTWLWDGNDWTQVFPAHVPMGRWLHSMAYDSRRQVVVLYGGSMLGTQPYTWEWDGVDWIAQDIAEPDPWRWNAAMTYDPLRGTTVLFGGENGRYFWGDTWQRAGGGDWIEALRPKHPVHRTGAYLAYFPRLRSSVLYGGSQEPNVFINDTWAWMGKKWIELPLDPHPIGRCGGTVYDTVLRGLLTFIGCRAPGVLSNETWLLR